MLDVLIAGAGPAGSIAALVLARAGVRVRLIDRARFPRTKLCGDTLNPGTMAALSHLGLSGPIEAAGLPIDGMLLTGARGERVEGRYPHGLTGRALVRRDLDALLLDAAIRAGAECDEGVTAREPIVNDGAVAGLRVSTGSSTSQLPARLTIAADGRRSTLAFGLKLANHPQRPRRWAIGAYFTGVAGLTSLGEMHVRDGHYIGVARVPGDLTNVCLVISPTETPCAFGDPRATLMDVVTGDPILRDRMSQARLIEGPTLLGPLAVDGRAAGVPGLLLAGDAAGFVDPMTGDGLRFAVHGGRLAADAAIAFLQGTDARPDVTLAVARARAFGPKIRFNRLMRRVVSSAGTIRVAAATTRIAPSILRLAIGVAGDVRSARPQ